MVQGGGSCENSIYIYSVFWASLLLKPFLLKTVFGGLLYAISIYM
jgi:hypothetical protein